MVWAVPHALALRHSVDEVVEACELLALTAATEPHARPRGAAEGQQLRHQIQWELDVLGLSGAGVMFEGLGEPHTTVLDMETFAFHAQVCQFLSRAINMHTEFQLVLLPCLADCIHLCIWPNILSTCCLNLP